MGAYERMLATVPSYLRTSEYFKALLIAEGMEIDVAKAGADDLMDQLFVALATYGLSLWEERLGLPINPANRTLKERRERITAKRRGSGTSTKAMMEQIAESYTNGEVDPTEQNDLYQFTIRFVSEIGIPTQIDDLKAAIEEAKPAHLAVLYAYTYITHGQLSVKTHAYLAGFTHEQLRSDGSVIA